MQKASQLTTGHVTFGPFANSAAATIWVIANLINKMRVSNRNSYGIIWSEPTGLAILRLPHYNAKGIGNSILIEYHGPVRPAAAADGPTTEAFHSIDYIVREYYRVLVAPAQELARAADREKPVLKSVFNKPVNSLNQLYAEESAGNKLGYIGIIDDVKSAIEGYAGWADRHPIEADGVSIAADVIGVVANSVAVVFSLKKGHPILAGGAAVAAVGSLVALISDGRDAYYRLQGEMASYYGDQKSVIADALAARRYEHTEFYRRTELLAPIANMLGVATDTAGTVAEFSKASSVLAQSTSTLGTTTADLNAAQAALTERQGIEANAIRLQNSDPHDPRLPHVFANQEQAQALKAKLTKMPSTSDLNSAIAKATRKVSDAVKEHNDAVSELHRVVLNSFLPHEEAIDGEKLFGRISKLPEGGLSTDYVGEAYASLAFQSLGTSQKTPSSRSASTQDRTNSTLIKSHFTTKSYYSASIFTSTLSGQPRQMKLLYGNINL